MSKPSQLMLGKFLLNWCHPTLSRITSFRTLSLFVCPQNHRNIRISATLSCRTCRLFVGQHSAPAICATLCYTQYGVYTSTKIRNILIAPTICALHKRNLLSKRWRVSYTLLVCFTYDFADVLRQLRWHYCTCPYMYWKIYLSKRKRMDNCIYGG